MRGVLLCLLLAGCPVVALAAPAMEAGVQAYRQGDFPAALGYFRQAAAEQPDDNAVQFNLGLTLYRTGDYLAARTIFLRRKKQA